MNQECKIFISESNFSGFLHVTGNGVKRNDFAELIERFTFLCYNRNRIRDKK